MKNNIGKLLKEREITQKDFAAKLGIHHTNFSNIVRGKTNPKDPTLFQQIADALNVRLADLFVLEGDEDSGTPSAEHDIIKNAVPFGGIVQAGAFLDVDLHTQHAQRFVAIAPDPRFRKARQFAWQVVGDSMNEAKIYDGMWVLGVETNDYVEHYQPIMSGDVVVVERLRFSGQERELTVKEYWEEPAGVALIPKSTNKHHKAIFLPRNGSIEGEEVRIVGIVTGAYTLFGKPIFEMDP